MVDFLEISIDDIWEEPECSSVVSGLVYDDFTKEDLYEVLKNSNIIAIHNGVDMLGFFSFEDLDCGECEAHIYIYEQFRGKSKEILKDCLKELFSGYGFKRVITTVTSKYSYVVRFLRGLLFKQYGVLKGFIKSEWKPLDVYIMVLDGEV